jgi:hypothetical protein
MYYIKSIIIQKDIIFGFEAGLVYSSPTISVNLNRNTFINCRTVNNGGAIYLEMMNCESCGQSIINIAHAGNIDNSLVQNIRTLMIVIILDCRR